jgi:hypothetical protein
MRILKSRSFHRWARKEGISNETLLEAIDEVSAGLIDADLGGGLIKKRMARMGGGKRGGYRTIVVHQQFSRSVFVLGFAKNERQSLEADELVQFKLYARDLLALTDEQVDELVVLQKLFEVT